MVQRDISELIRKYLSEGKVMQLATVRDDQPWVCSVYFVADKELNIYWLSLPERRHSQELATNTKAAITIPIKLDQPVIGLSVEGVAKVVSDPKQIRRTMKLYINRYQTGEKFYDNFIAGKNKHLLYHFKPAKFVLFDEVNLPPDTSVDWRPE